MSHSPRTVDEISPEGRWTFDGDVTAAFDDMLSRSIPQYEEMRRLCYELACPFVKDGTVILDLGCSRGEAMAPFIDKWGARCRHVGVEVSKPMLEAARARYKGLSDCGVVEIKRLDLRENYPPVKASVTLCVLTLQFVPMEHRQRVLADAYEATLPGGCLILVEKVLGATARLDRILTTRYLALKAEHGYTQEQIERKRLALEGVLVPVTAAWNEELLRQAGFAEVDCFWRWCCFAGWIAVKR